MLWLPFIGLLSLFHAMMLTFLGIRYVKSAVHRNSKWKIPERPKCCSMFLVAIYILRQSCLLLNITVNIVLGLVCKLSLIVGAYDKRQHSMCRI